MQHASAIDILTRHGLRRDGDTWHAPGGAVVSVYLAQGVQSLVLDRIVSISLGTDTAFITTARKEIYGVELADLRAIRVTPEATGPGYR
ncbi:MAG: hypothetical protein KBG48_24175 [Kofleriaceae bacterium]|jgi:hypothetical protein|nr:hypothetical protein [Kofleriaceae bacterium]MBP9170524.1 hypothetical protein [Kofleriaceae bacterium]MBP9860857.1 hypothetical protein [Kofleriaceae bacterium]